MGEDLIGWWAHRVLVMRWLLPGGWYQVGSCRVYVGSDLSSISTGDPTEVMEGTCSPGEGSSGAWPWALLGSELSRDHLCSQAAVRATGACDGVSMTWPESQGRAGTVPSAWCFLDPAWILHPLWVRNTRTTLTNW